MAKSKVEWHGIEAMQGRINQYRERVKQVGFQVLEYYAPQIEAYGKKNAPWTDRTANARQSLHTRVYVQGDMAILEFRHGVYYGIFLELRWQGRYAIIMGTLQNFYNPIFITVKDALS